MLLKYEWLFRLMNDLLNWNQMIPIWASIYESFGFNTICECWSNDFRKYGGFFIVWVLIIEHKL